MEQRYTPLLRKYEYEGLKKDFTTQTRLKGHCPVHKKVVIRAWVTHARTQKESIQMEFCEKCQAFVLPVWTHRIVTATANHPLFGSSAAEIPL